MTQASVYTHRVCTAVFPLSTLTHTQAEIKSPVMVVAAQSVLMSSCQVSSQSSQSIPHRTVLAKGVCVCVCVLCNKLIVLSWACVEEQGLPKDLEALETHTLLCLSHT